jgi:hypothetical protein
MKKLPLEIIQHILKIKWFNALKERLERILHFPIFYKQSSYFGYVYYKSIVDFNGKRYVFSYRPDNNHKILYIDKHYICCWLQ